MKIEEHLKADDEFAAALEKLKVDLFTNRRAIVETCVVAAANLVNAHLHRLALLPISRDVKHNRIESYLRTIELEEKDELVDAVGRLEQLKYAVVHGVTRNSELCKEALSKYEKVRQLCRG